MTDPIASEPAEPTTRQDPELWWSPTMGAIRKFGDNFRVYGGGGNYWGWFLAQDWPADAVRLVLADPAQTTELLSPEISQTIVGLGRNLAAARRAQIVAEEREQAAERRETLRQDERDAVQARYEALSLEIGVASGREWVRAARLSLLLRGMARKLVAYRKWTTGDDVPVVHRLRREAAERQARIADLEASVGHHVTMRGDAVAQREMLKTRIAAALAVCDEYPAGWNAPTLAHDRLRAALVGDQPPAEEPLHWRTEDGGIAAVMCGSCSTLGGHDDDCPRLSGVALRDVEEADDASKEDQ